MKIIKETPRKILRYLMFTKKNGIKLKKPITTKKGDKEIIQYFESLEGFTKWDDFDIKWDIGMGNDLVAKANRKEKWFLFNNDKTQIVKIPTNYWEEEAKRKNTSTHSLFLQECNHRGLTMDKFFKLFF